jgi:uncharacterized protein (TIGR03086 family)
MELRSLMIQAADTTAQAMRAVDPDRLGAPTPCTEYDLRTLVNHVVLWTGPRAEGAARKQPVEGTDGGPAGASAEGVDVTRNPGWIEEYAAQARRTAQAWSDPAAWEGSTGLSAAGRMPADFVGGILFGEFLLHAWDLAAATGTRPEIGDELAEALHERLAAMAHQAREFKVFGPEVAVPESAPALDRALGLAGRDPSWGR